MTTIPLELPEGACCEIAGEVKRFGAAGVETGGFVMASANGSEVQIVAMAGEVGIDRRPFLFQISEIAIDRLFGFADDLGLWIPAQFHSHRHGAFLSPTDEEYGFRVEGFVSAVIPSFATPATDPALWGWWRYSAENWQIASSPSVGRGSIRVVRFDEDGVIDA